MIKIGELLTHLFSLVLIYCEISIRDFRISSLVDTSVVIHRTSTGDVSKPLTPSALVVKILLEVVVVVKRVENIAVKRIIDVTSSAIETGVNKARGPSGDAFSVVVLSDTSCGIFKASRGSDIDLVITF